MKGGQDSLSPSGEQFNPQDRRTTGLGRAFAQEYLDKTNRGRVKLDRPSAAMNPLFVRLDWRFVGALGELHILTRASYAMLGIVPLLAGLWSKLPWEITYLPRSWVFAFLAALAVTLGQIIYQLRAPETIRHSTLDQYIRDASQDYSQQPTSERLEDADQTLDARHYLHMKNRFRKYYPPANVIAALQYGITEIIAKNEFLADIFVMTITDSYTTPICLREDIEKNLKDRLISIVNGIRIEIDKVGDYMKRELYHLLIRDAADLLEFHIEHPAARVSQFTRDLGMATVSAIGAELLHRAFPGLEERDVLHNITKIGYAARVSYLLEANRRKLSMWAASILYAAAIAVISIITVDQTIAVLKAAGWL